MSISGGITKISTTGSDFTNTVLDNIRLTAFWSSLIGVGVSGNNATGTFNTILGYEAVNQGRFGDFNVVVGTRAATFMEGQRNTLLGTQVAARLFYGNDNTITGCDAASAEVFGAENTLYGSLTAFGEGGIGNACFGYNARTRVNDATGAPSQHSVAFGHSAAATGAYAVALGGTAVALGDGALAVGPRPRPEPPLKRSKGLCHGRGHSKDLMRRGRYGQNLMVVTIFILFYFRRGT